jgi:transcription initiation factor TFIID subunit 15
MGRIPSTANMISSIIISPGPGQNLRANKDFTISVQTTGLAAGSFTNAQLTYYSAPQDLTSSGQIIGHTHVTVQSLGNNFKPSEPPDPAAFVFFKGINDAGNGKGLLSAVVGGGLPKGHYRVCTMTSASNHQPVLMPVAQRGAQDDCQKFQVT